MRRTLHSYPPATVETRFLGGETRAFGEWHRSSEGAFVFSRFPERIAPLDVYIFPCCPSGDLRATAPAAEVLVPQLSLPAEVTPKAETMPEATAPTTAASLSVLPSGPPPPPPPYSSSSSPSSSPPSSPAASYSNVESPSRNGSCSSRSQPSDTATPPSPLGSGRQSEPYSGRKNRPRRRRRHRHSTNQTPTPHRSHRPSGRLRSNSRHRRRGASSTPDVRPRSVGRAPPSSATECGSKSYSSDDQSSHWSSTDTSVQPHRDRHYRTNNRRSSRRGDGRRRSYTDEEYDEQYRRRSHRGREGKHHSGRRYERRYSRDRRRDQRT